MPIPQLSSLLLTTKYLPILGPTLRAWFELVRTEAEFVALCRATRSVPVEWIDWADGAAARRIAHGAVVADPLAYRLAILLNGVINLQEGKYLLDTIETALRVELLEHARKHGIELAHVRASVPEKPRIAPEPQTLAELVAGCTFYQLTELYARNWNHVRGAPKPNERFEPGFWRVFADGRGTRDVNRFRTAMTAARRCRNDIAHTKRLFDRAELERLHRDLADWLAALHIDLRTRVERYRLVRPNFLAGLV